MKKALCQSASDGVTRAFARKLVAGLTTGGALLLAGELGSGKTTFVQGLAEALGIQRTITSPTFTLLNLYDTHHPVIHQLVHLDLYRIEDSSMITELDLPTWLANPRALVVVEWPERAPELWRGHTLGTIQFSLGATINHRILAVEGEIATLFDSAER
ncbi:MAG: tRNA (adenosine(37)-N6)-threonylcarbamoyltransferase complex ATPase subunit type 1 TsaE [Candidatus Kerfeldbacteria bacterium]|nr:tRNA (adenosine(37)-N6)-threonylcarbamoyltransferase complex ATPase subunit type 1 TsaE [Candidatus Kerfeldbacteria bacterium]